MRGKKAAIFALLVALVLAPAIMSRAPAEDHPTDEYEHYPDPVPRVAPGLANPCAGIQFSYREDIEQQTILGFIPDILHINTPSEHDANILKAIDRNTYLAWESYYARAEAPRYDYDSFIRRTPHELRPLGGILGLMGFDFPMGELCVEAKKRGFKRLTFVCANTSDSEDRGPHDHPNEMSTVYYLTTECFISTHPDKRPSMKELKAKMWGPPIKESQYAGSGGMSSYENDGTRQDIYVPLIKRLVSWPVAVARDAAAQAARAAAAASAPNPAPVPGTPYVPAPSPAVSGRSQAN
jgi:hypothetical protein